MKRLIRNLTVVAALSAAGMTLMSSAAASVASRGPTTFFGGTVTAVLYTADPGEANHVTITQAARFEIEDTGATITAVPPCTSVDTHHATCPGRSFDGSILEVELGDGDDFFKLDEVFADLARLSGGDGDDTILGGDFFNEWIFGGAGDDVLKGRGEEDIIDGGPGADTMRGGSSGISHANAFHSHIDTVTYEDRANGVTVDADNVADDGEAGEGDNVLPDFEEVIGGSGNDHLVGLPHGGFLSGQEGNDFLEGGTSFDSLGGGPGNDVLRGGPRQDFLSGNEGEDRLLGGRGPDWINGGPAGDYLVGGLGHDRLLGKGGNDIFRVRDGHKDFVTGGNGRDRARIDALLDVVRGVERFLR